MKYLSLVFTALVVLVLISCNGGGDDCSECEKDLEDSQAEFDAVLKRYFVLENQAIKCALKVDSLKEIPPDTIYLHIIDTLVLRDTIIKSDTIYRTDTVCVPGPECDTVILTRLLLYNGDTNWVMNKYIACPLEDFEIYTDILLTGFSTGMHYGEHNYEFGCVVVTVNETDTLIRYGRHICLDLSLEYGQYITRVMLPMDSIRTIEYTFYNDNMGSWLGETEDVNLYIYGISVDTMDVFSPEYITHDNVPAWRDENSYLQLNRNGTFIIQLK